MASCTRSKPTMCTQAALAAPACLQRGQPLTFPRCVKVPKPIGFKSALPGVNVSRQDLVRQVMKDRQVLLPEASAIIKREGLYVAKSLR